MKHYEHGRGQRFPEDFERIDDVEADDKILIHDASDNATKFAFPSQLVGKYAPTIVEDEGNDENNYRLRITSDKGEIITPNLKGPPGAGDGSENWEIATDEQIDQLFINQSNQQTNDNHHT